MTFSALILPLIFAVIAVFFFVSKKDMSSIFARGCREGAELTYKLLPTFIMLIVGVRMFCASGGMEAVCDALKPLCALLGVPCEIAPIAVMRPVSGSGANAVLAEIFAVHGADSMAGLSACVFMGSTDTIIYTLSVYLSAAKTKKAGAALPISFLVMIFSLAFSCFIARLFFKIG